MNRTPQGQVKVKKQATRAQENAAPRSDGDRMNLRDEDKRALLAQLESIERNFSGVQKMLERLRATIEG